MKMMNKFRIAVVLLCASVTSCGGNDDSSGVVAKPINSAWTSTENKVLLNFEDAVIGQQLEIAMALVNEKTCRCTILIIGTANKGTITTSACTELSAGTSSSPSCTDAEAAPTYSIENNILTLCRNGKCSTWE